MEHIISLTPIQVLDCLLRSAAAGVLLFLCFVPRVNQTLIVTLSKALLLVCLASYVLLTMPIANEDYGWWRPPLLLFTDLTAYALLNVYWYYIHRCTLWEVLPSVWKAISTVWLTWLVVFFLYFNGNGAFHLYNHWVGLVVLLFIIGDSIKGYADDLVERTRQLRRVSVACLSVYMSFLIVLELLSSELRDNTAFSLGHAVIMTIVVFIAGNRVYLGNASKQANTTTANFEDEPANSSHGSPSVQSELATRVIEALEQGIFIQHELKVDDLADVLNVPPHQLRATINQELGFDNFSQFINGYRIERVCQLLKSREHQNLPILTLALDSGFSSIASFNRVFKANKGLTPTQYRAQFQK